MRFEDPLAVALRIRQPLMDVGPIERQTHVRGVRGEVRGRHHLHPVALKGEGRAALPVVVSVDLEHSFPHRALAEQGADFELVRIRVQDGLHADADLSGLLVDPADGEPARLPPILAPNVIALGVIKILEI